ncbi:MAG TPA: DUF2207 domain-containing protein [Verrucomicrobiae bacterium]|nr:DUF2207 domain-containing protein [Verrucomicrobiae bacterium]
MIRRYCWIVCITFIWLAIFPASAALERISHFDSQITVQSNATLLVTETIDVTADGQQMKHGIYRDFPQLYHGKFGLRVRTRFDVLNVERDGKPEPYHLEKRDNGVRVYIGSATALLPSGQHSYRITYKTGRQLGFFDTHDELYWNVTGNAWSFPIDLATATVTLPTGAMPHDLIAYTGAQGSRATNYSVEMINGNAHFETTRRLNVHEGLTIVVEWPKGFVVAPTIQTKGMALMSDNQGLTLATICFFFLLLYYIAAWMMVGRDLAHGIIMARSSPPEKFSPAAVRYLVRMGFDDKAFAAAILNLAVKGKITIREEARKQYILTRTDADYDDLLPEEKTLLQNLLDRGRPLRLIQAHYSTLQNARKELQRQLKQSEEEIYFKRNWRYWLPGLIFSVVPVIISLMDASDIATALFMFVWLTPWTAVVTLLISQVLSSTRRGYGIKSLPLALFSLPFLAGEVLGIWFLVHSTSIWVVAIFVCSISLNGIFYHLMKAPTLAGRKILDQIEGFKLFLSGAEKDRLNVENPPDQTPALFEKFLPYALALGIEQKWSEQFAQILKEATIGPRGASYMPLWYQGAAWSALDVAAFGTSLGTTFSSTIASAATAPGESSGGSSGGSGGGGSSGGGGGGGGGGGW